MKFTLLGSGTSQGIPVIGCTCNTCISTDSRDKRLRCSAYFQNEGNAVLIDAGPDFRMQALRYGVNYLDAVLLTHEHNDHVAGMDDLRPLYFRKGKPIPIIAEQFVLDQITTRYDYAFAENPYPGAPKFDLIPIEPGDVLRFGNLHIRACRLYHGNLPILGFILQNQIAYFTDTNNIPELSIEQISGIDYLFLDALHHNKHYSHHSLSEALDAVASINPKKTFLIHLSHMMGPTGEWEKKLPENVFPSYDGQIIDLQTD